MTDQTLTLEEQSARSSRQEPTAPGVCRVLCSDDLRLGPLWVSLEGVDGLDITRGPAGVERHDDGGRKVLQLSLDDGRASRPHARISRVAQQLVLEDLGSKNGTIVDGKPVTRSALRDGDVIEVGRTMLLFRAAVPRSALASLPISFVAPGLPTLVTASPALAAVLSSLQRVAASSVPVLLCGETGTGKEVIAQRLHALSGRKGALVAVNCGALPADLVEAELFGARKGAYSGALVDRTGLVRAADHGTLFLDEIGDLPLPSQAALLRVLQEREVVPVGSVQPIAVDFRLVSATHRDLDQMVAAGAFRADLRARLGGITLSLPPLRERREDLGTLVSAFCRASSTPVSLSAAAARALMAAAFTGNVRALQRAVEGALARAAVSGDTVLLEEEHFPDLAKPDERAAAAAADPTTDPPLDDDLGRRLVALLVEHRGNVSAVARALGKQRMQVYRWIERSKLDPDRFR